MPLVKDRPPTTGREPTSEDGPGLRDRVQRAIEDDIATGTLRPGDKLEERLLAAKYGLSRTPVREALNRLVTMGLIETRPRQGSFVGRIAIPELLAIFEVNCELEALAARFSARRMSDAERSELSRLTDKGRLLAESGATDAYVTHNTSYHLALSHGTHNSYLEGQIEAVKRRSLHYRRNTFRLPGRLGDSAAEHEEITGAVVGGDEERAFALMHAHTDIHRPEYRDFVFMLWQLETG